MCGRYRAKGQLIDHLPEDYFRENRLLAKFEDCYNIGPGQKAPIVRKRKKERPQVESIAWRQPPYYLARSDSLLTKPSHRQALLERRCLITMHVIYEWDDLQHPDAIGFTRSRYNDSKNLGSVRVTWLIKPPSLLLHHSHPT